MKKIFISWPTGSGKSTALRTLVGDDNVYYWNLSLAIKISLWTTSIWIDEYDWKDILDGVIGYLSAQGITHIYIATEYPDLSFLLK